MLREWEAVQEAEDVNGPTGVGRGFEGGQCFSEAG